jgi:hypothetical protein
MELTVTESSTAPADTSLSSQVVVQIGLATTPIEQDTDAGRLVGEAAFVYVARSVADTVEHQFFSLDAVHGEALDPYRMFGVWQRLTELLVHTLPASACKDLCTAVQLALVEAGANGSSSRDRDRGEVSPVAGPPESSGSSSGSIAPKKVGKRKGKSPGRS